MKINYNNYQYNLNKISTILMIKKIKEDFHLEQEFKKIVK